MPNSKIILSADSTCDLGEELKSRYQVHYYPFHIILNGKEYQDNVDISTEEIYRAYYKDHSLPQTAAINAAEYVEYFRQFTDQGYEVIHLNLGGALSSERGLSHRQSESFHRHCSAGHRRGRYDRARLFCPGDRHPHQRTAHPLPCQLYPGYPGFHACRRAVFLRRGSWSRHPQSETLYRSGQPHRRHERGQKIPRKAGKIRPYPQRSYLHHSFRYRSVIDRRCAKYDPGKRRFF